MNLRTATDRRSIELGLLNSGLCLIGLDGSMHQGNIPVLAREMLTRGGETIEPTHVKVRLLYFVAT